MKLVCSVCVIITIAYFLPRVNSGAKKLRRFKCVDTNLQRTLTWEARNRSKVLQLREYRLEYRVASLASYSDLRCYADENRTEEIKKVIQPWCKTSVLQLIPWNYLVFRLQAVYWDNRKNKTIKSPYVERGCGPIESHMNLTSPTVQIQAKKDAITVHTFLPPQLSKAMSILGDYELDIRYYFCIYQGDGECEEREEKCNPFYTFLSLEPGTNYFVESWFRSRGDSSADFIDSKRNKTIVQTQPDPFPTRSKIILVTMLSVMFVVLVLSAIITRTVLRMSKKWHEYIKRDLPKFIIATKEELLKKKTAGNSDSALWESTGDDLNIPPLSRIGQSCSFSSNPIPSSTPGVRHQTDNQSSNTASADQVTDGAVNAHYTAEPHDKLSAQTSLGLQSPPPYVQHHAFPSNDPACYTESKETRFVQSVLKPGNAQLSNPIGETAYETKTSAPRSHETVSPNSMSVCTDGYSSK